MAKKNFFIKPTDEKNKKKSLEHFKNDENSVLDGKIFGGWREMLTSNSEGDIQETPVTEN